MKAIDFHAHAFPDNIEQKAIKNLESHYTINVPNKASLDELLASTKSARVDKLVLLVAATKPALVKMTNDWVANISSKIPDKIIGFGSIHPNFKKYEKELDRMEQLCLKGIKIHPKFQGFDLDDPRMWLIYEAIGNRFLVLFHVGNKHSKASSPAKLAKILELLHTNHGQL